MSTLIKPITYKDAGVDITKGNLFVKQIKGMVRSTRREGVLADIGSFSGLFRLAIRRYREPVLVSSADGVGTKLMIAQMAGRHRGIGVDLVGMCANDIATTGAEGLFFLDYIATGRLRPRVLKEILAGISSACKEAGYALIGGETAEMPGMYDAGKYDLAGFCVGIVEKKKIIDGHNIKRGDKVLGLASNGLHSNGYSLVRKLFSKKELMRYGDVLLKPTRLYAKPLLALQRRIGDKGIKGIAHITGGAYLDKIPRIIPHKLAIEVNKESWQIPRIFRLIQEKGRIKDRQMYGVFNMGVGMVVVLSPSDIRRAQNLLARFNIKSWVIGEVIRGSREVRLI